MKRFGIVLIAMAIAFSACSRGGNGSTGGGGSSSGGTAPVPPVAAFTSSATTGEAPFAITFNGTSSTDSDGTILAWAWDFGDGFTGAGAVVTHTFLPFGVMSVMLTVTDSQGLTDTEFMSVSIIAEDCPTFDTGTTPGTIASPALIEASGIAPSRMNGGVLWAHNDSGDTPRLFAMNTTGTHLGTYTFSGASAVDWEDMAVGPGPVAGAQYLYAGDIGDNTSTRPGIVVYRVLEPSVSSVQAPIDVILTGVEAFPLTYPDGAHNAETLMVDPVSGDFFIVSKDPTGISNIYRKAAPHVDGVAATMTLVATMTFGTGALPGSPLATGGDISPLGNEVIIRTYSNAFVWIRDGGTALETAFAKAPCSVPLIAETQGEAIGFGADGRSYWTVSEGTSEPLHLFVRTD